MSVKQLPLPGFDDGAVAEKLPAIVLLYMAHLALRDDMRQRFDCEIAVLREMGRMNSHECSDDLYLAQRQLCTAIKEVVIKLDVMNDMMTMDGNNG